MYKDLAHAVEDIKNKGYRNLFEDQKTKRLIESDDMHKAVGNLEIEKIYHFDEGTDPGDESTLYTVKQPDQSKWYIILSYGMYKDPDKTDFIDALKKLEENAS